MELLAQEEQFTAILNDYDLKCRVRLSLSLLTHLEHP